MLVSVRGRLLAVGLNLVQPGADVAVLYHTDVGVKVRNRLVDSDFLVYPFLEDRYLGKLDPSCLDLGIDGLKDEHTLIDTALKDSPHYALMEALERDDDLADTNPYLLCSRLGTLDFRWPHEITPAFLATLRERFERHCGLVEAGEPLKVKVIRVLDRMYIADGKHRAALALLKGIEVEGEDATPVYYDSFFRWIERKMRERAAEYSKHLELFDALHECREPARSSSN